MGSEMCIRDRCKDTDASLSRYTYWGRHPFFGNLRTLVDLPMAELWLNSMYLPRTNALADLDWSWTGAQPSVASVRPSTDHFHRLRRQ